MIALSGPAGRALTRLTLNARLALVLTGFLALCPLLYASGPLAGPTFALGLALLAVGYGVALGHKRQGFLLLNGAGAMPLVLAWLGVCAFVALQCLPLGLLIGPFAITGGLGQTLESRTLSLAPGASHLAGLELLGHGVMFVLIARVGLSRRRANLMLAGLFWLCAVYASLSLVGFEPARAIIRSDSHGSFFALGAVLGMAQFFDARQLRRRDQTGKTVLYSWGFWFKCAGVGVLMAALAVNRLGTALVWVFVASAVLCILGSARLPGPTRQQCIILVVLAAALLAAAVHFIGADSRIGILTPATRQAFFEQIWQMIAARPLLGYGAGAFELAFPLFHDPTLDPSGPWHRAHSVYLTAWAELGMVAGTVPLLVIVGLTLHALYQLLWREGPDLPPLAAVGAICLAAPMASVDFGLEFKATSYLFCAVLALSFANGKIGSQVRR